MLDCTIREGESGILGLYFSTDSESDGDGAQLQYITDIDYQCFNGLSQILDGIKSLNSSMTIGDNGDYFLLIPR